MLELILKTASKSCKLDPIPTSLTKQYLDALVPVITRGVRFYRFSGFYRFALFTVRKTGSFKKTRKTGFYRGHNYQYHAAKLEASSMAESQEKFVANPKGKAPIWEFFRFRCKDGQVDSTKAYCTECNASVKLGGSTSNMSAHVCRHHPLLLNKPFGKAKVTSVRNPPALHPSTVQEQALVPLPTGRRSPNQSEDF